MRKTNIWKVLNPKGEVLQAYRSDTRDNAMNRLRQDYPNLHHILTLRFGGMTEKFYIS